jgi:DNA-binding response OmpR family regulator
MSETLENKKDTQPLIWVVDDDEAILEAVHIILEEAEYNAEIFNTGDSLKNALKTTKPNLILLDVVLTKENGKDISKEIKGNKNTEHIPLILMSANHQLDRDIKECKANAYIKKPFDIDTLIGVVDEHL